MSLKSYLIAIFLGVSCTAGPLEGEFSQYQPDSPLIQQESYVGGRDVAENEIGHFEYGLVQKLNGKCTRREESACTMVKIIDYVNTLLKKSNITIMQDVEVEQTQPAEERTEDLPRSFTSESEEVQAAEIISAKFLSFLRSRALKLRLLPSLEAVITSNPDQSGNLNFGMSMRKIREVEEGRGKYKGGMMKHGGGGLIAAFLMKVGLLKAFGLKALAFLVGKALLISKLALLLGALLGLKKLFSQGQDQKHVTFEVHSIPQITHSFDHTDYGHYLMGGGDTYMGGYGDGFGDWNRRSDLYRMLAQRMAYRNRRMKP